MKNKTITASLSLLTVAGFALLTALPAAAGGGGGGHGSRDGGSRAHGQQSHNSHGYGQGHRNYGDHNSSRRYNNAYSSHNYSYQPKPYYKPRYTYSPGRQIVYSPYITGNRYYQSYRPRYRPGGYMPYQSSYVIYDYARYGLYQPPYGYQWVRYDNDAYLAAAGTGLVAGIIIGALFGG